MLNPLRGSVGILGGSFNPVHNAHLRMALEAREALGLERVDLLPAKHPPHKGVAGLLPFSLRLELLHLAVAKQPGLGVNPLEGDMPEPSYSFDTLSLLNAQHPERNHVFIMGSTDLVTLPEWHRGLELPLVVDIAIVDRHGVGLDVVDRFLQAHWQCFEESSWMRRIAGGKLVAFVSMPRLDISASLIRERFCSGRDICGFVPEAVRERMLAQARLVTQCWSVLP